MVTFCLILGKKRENIWLGWDLNPWSVDSHANHYLLHWSLVRKLANLFMKHTLWCNKKWVLACQSFGEYCQIKVTINWLYKSLSNPKLWSSHHLPVVGSNLVAANICYSLQFRELKKECHLFLKQSLHNLLWKQSIFTKPS